MKLSGWQCDICGETFIYGSSEKHDYKQFPNSITIDLNTEGQLHSQSFEKEMEVCNNCASKLEDIILTYIMDKEKEK